MYAAERLNCPPKTLLADPNRVPNRVWIWWALTLGEAEGIANDERARSRAQTKPRQAIGG